MAKNTEVIILVDSQRNDDRAILIMQLNQNIHFYSLSLKTVPDKPSGWSVIAYNALLDRVLGLGFPREFL